MRTAPPPTRGARLCSSQMKTANWLSGKRLSGAAAITITRCAILTIARDGTVSVTQAGHPRR